MSPSARVLSVAPLLAVLAAAFAGCEGPVVPTPPDFVNDRTIIPLEVTGFTPGQGVAGDTVRVTGEGFSDTEAFNLVYIGGAGVPVIASTETTLAVTVPVYAGSGPIRVSDAPGIRSGTSETLFEVRAPAGLVTGYNGEAGEPTITSSGPDTYSVGPQQSTAFLSGSVGGAAGDGNWAILDAEGFVRSQGRLPVDAGSYSQVVPIFCGQQRLSAFFGNDVGRAFYVVDLTRTDCTEVGLRVQLSWDTDQTDVDLHLLKPNGSYGDSFSDCYYANPSPDWGVQADTSDNPVLDVDDRNGYGPENIFLDPGEDGTYTVIVHYFSDNAQGPSNAWIEVFIDGNRSAFGPYRLWGTGARWSVCEVSWPLGTVTPLQF